MVGWLIPVAFATAAIVSFASTRRSRAWALSSGCMSARCTFSMVKPRRFDIMQLLADEGGIVFQPSCRHAWNRR